MRAWLDAHGIGLIRRCLRLGHSAGHSLVHESSMTNRHVAHCTWPLAEFTHRLHVVLPGKPLKCRGSKTCITATQLLSPDIFFTTP